MEVGEEPVRAPPQPAGQADSGSLRCGGSRPAPAGPPPLLPRRVRRPGLPLPYPKGELGGTVGRASCAMLALTDVGLAATLLARLAAGARRPTAPASAELSREKADKALQRQKEQRRHEKKLPKRAEGSRGRPRRPGRSPRGDPAGEADAAPGQADPSRRNAMRPWHTIGLEQRGLVSNQNAAAPPRFPIGASPPIGGGLFAEQQVSRARGGQGFQERTPRGSPTF